MESVTVPKERIGTYFDEVFHLLVSNNLYSLRAKVRQNKGKNEDADFVKSRFFRTLNIERLFVHRSTCEFASLLSENEQGFL